MEYNRISVSYEEAKDRFYRVLDIRSDLNLVYVGCILCTALSCEFEHNFMFRSNKKAYVPESFTGNGYDGWKPMKDYILKDLGPYFTFEYDTGDGWEFECETLGSYNNDDTSFAILIDGKGQGVWEDNKYSLDMYLSGLVSPSADHDPKNPSVTLPWNHENVCFADFEDYDLAEEQQYFEDFYLDDINEYVDGYHRHGFEKDVRYVDPELYYSGENPFVDGLDLYDGDEPFDWNRDQEMDQFHFDDEDLLTDSYVNMQISSYYLIKGLLEHFSLLYPEKDEYSLMEIVKEQLLREAYRSLDDFMDDMDEDDFESEDEEYH